MNVTQENLINDIAVQGGIDVTTVRDVLKTAENIIFAYLSSTAPSENVHIKVLDGLSLNSTYIPQRLINRGIFENYSCNCKVKLKPNVSRHYVDKLNRYFE